MNWFSVSPKDLSETFVHKVTLSTPLSLHNYHNEGSSGGETLVMVILGGEFRDIAFCQLAGAESWTLLNDNVDDNGSYVDIMYSRVINSSMPSGIGISTIQTPYTPS